ncbi:MAG TPA: DNRLRE domain-containing protein [Pilimelia sp.]|nr:DNRLRE domain-containing protein [Pilimelia sp.]
MTHKRNLTMGATLAGALVSGGLALTGSAAAAGTHEVRIAASDDAYVSATRLAYNTGQADKLVAGRIAGETKVAFLKFRVGALATGSAITGAELKLVTDGHAVPGTLTVSRVADTTWSEKTLTAANDPAIGTAVAQLRPAADATVVRVNVGALVTKPGVYSFAVKSSAVGDAARFLSAESGAEGPSIKLTVRQPVVASPSTPAPRPTTAQPTTPAPRPTTAQPTTPAPQPTTAQPTTPAPQPTTAQPTTPAPQPTTAQPTTPAECTTDAKLVPSCGVLWGAAAGGFSDTPRDQALKEWEQASGRTAAIFHQYHKGDELFPTRAEIAMTRDAARPRVLLINWKVAEGTTWAKVAAGEKNARIDRLAAHLKANYTDRFFLAPHHEPENDVNPAAGSGMTAKDFATMYRHVVTRLKAQGVQNAINVLAYMGNEKWMAQSWWPSLYPGDDVVDWIGLDSYVSAQPGAYHYGDFANLLDRAPTGGGLGFYDWATTKHASKPLMIAEWGVYHSTTRTADKAAVFNTVLPTLRNRPGIKAMVYFDCEQDDEGDRNISISSSPETLTAFRKIAADPIFNVRLR